MAWEARESRFITNPAAAAQIQRLQDQADIYAKKTEQVYSGIHRAACARVVLKFFSLTNHVFGGMQDIFTQKVTPNYDSTAVLVDAQTWISLGVTAVSVC